MATFSRSVRRGLPRVEGGDPWPAAGQAPARIVSAGAAALSAPVSGAGSVTAAPAVPAPSAPAAARETAPAVLSAPVPAVNAGAAVARPLRRGLPRLPGGEPWPPAGEAPVSAGAPAAGATPAPVTDAAAAAAAAQTATAAAAAPTSTAPPAVPATAPAAPAAVTMGTTSLRRGLPRIPGGEPWPPAGLAPAAAAAPAVQADSGHIAQAPAASVVEAVAEAEPAATASAPAATAAPAAAQPAVAAEKPVRPRTEARLYGSRTRGQWIKLVVLLAVGAVAAAGILVLAARGVTTLPGVPEFLKRYPGAYPLPDTVEPGFPWWAQWAHFLNIFLMVLIIRSGYQVRTQQKPPAFWTPKRGGKKISINLWLHQSLDILWLVNGLIFVVLLFASGRWMRIVPTSWEAVPNALSALLQYMTLDWPVESGWVNYNSLQQIMYFLVVFIAAPLAAITGVRMSEFWPKDAKRLNKIYPVEVARAIHFPTMLFFVLFILIHVFLVFATGALRNLNHMFGGTDVVNWVGFWLFAAAIAITAAGWYAARPLIIAPIAKLFGQVSSR
ncbi:cytochrome b/b6 domain-containing protein [Arthrobacter sp. ok909]|uniref:cytochrome b/b6 domain-containing protein n=1 Tax=Arthrobacter sp. ok909 TaxID=1761746 RepID=UPI000B843A81|nr:cytochrome b/b6 domain-containing protein [Arthrobacter sp. ok909]